MQYKYTSTPDQYANQWAYYEPYGPDGFDGEDEISATPNKADGKVFYIDCVGRLTTDGTFGVLEYFTFTSGADVGPVYLLSVLLSSPLPSVLYANKCSRHRNQTTTFRYDQEPYITCSAAANGFLDCSAPGGYSIWQTTPLYEPLNAIMVFGKALGPGDQYYPFRWKYAVV
jgi:hypothetical protein